MTVGDPQPTRGLAGSMHPRRQIQRIHPMRRAPKGAFAQANCDASSDPGVWMLPARLLASLVQAGPQSPTFDQLYAWWSSHS